MIELLRHGRTCEHLELALRAPANPSVPDRDPDAGPFLPCEFPDSDGGALGLQLHAIVDRRGQDALRAIQFTWDGLVLWRRWLVPPPGSPVHRFEDGPGDSTGIGATGDAADG
jgi:hypothetical protein